MLQVVTEQRQTSGHHPRKPQIESWVLADPFSISCQPVCFVSSAVTDVLDMRVRVTCAHVTGGLGGAYSRTAFVAHNQVVWRSYDARAIMC